MMSNHDIAISLSWELDYLNHAKGFIFTTRLGWGCQLVILDKIPPVCPIKMEVSR